MPVQMLNHDLIKRNLDRLIAMRNLAAVFNFEFENATDTLGIELVKEKLHVLSAQGSRFGRSSSAVYHRHIWESHVHQDFVELDTAVTILSESFVEDVSLYLRREALIVEASLDIWSSVSRVTSASRMQMRYFYGRFCRTRRKLPS